MSERVDDGGPAYPSTEVHPNYDFPIHHFGMSLRDYFAAQALAGLLANPGGPFQANDMNGWDIVNCTLDDVARLSYQASDTMIATRARSFEPLNARTQGVEVGR